MLIRPQPIGSPTSSSAENYLPTDRSRQGYEVFLFWSSGLPVYLPERKFWTENLPYSLRLLWNDEMIVIRYERRLSKQFMMRTQYTGLLGTIQDSYYNNWTYASVANPDRGVLEPFPCGVTNIYRGQLLRICNGSTSESIRLLIQNLFTAFERVPRW